MLRTAALVALAAALAAMPPCAQELPPRVVPPPAPTEPPGPMGPYISPMVSSLSAPVIRELDGGTLTMVHAPAELHVGMSYIALFVDDEQGRADAGAQLSCHLYPPGEPDRGVSVFVWRAEPGRFLLREVLLKQPGERELAVRVIRPGREDEVEYFTLQVGEMRDLGWYPGVLTAPGMPGWEDSRREVAPIPGGRLTMLHYPPQPRVGMIHFQFIVQGRPEWLSLNTGMFRAGVGDFYDNLHLQKLETGIYIGYVLVPQPGPYIVRATVTTRGAPGYTVQFEVRVME